MSFKTLAALLLMIAVGYFLTSTRLHQSEKALNIEMKKMDKIELKTEDIGIKDRSKDISETVDENQKKAHKPAKKKQHELIKEVNDKHKKRKGTK